MVKRVTSFVRNSILAGIALLVVGSLGAQTSPAPPAPPAAPAPATTPGAPQTPEPAQPERPPRPPRPPRVSTRVHVGSGYGVGMGSGSFLGVDITDVTQDRVAPLKLPDESGVEITAVDQDSPAGKAKLQEHDVIRTFNGQRVDSAEQMRRLIREVPPGRTVELGISREGKPLSMKVQLGDRQTMVNVITMPEIHVAPMPPMNMDNFPFEMGARSWRSGMQLESLTPQLREFFGVPSGQGLLVRSVERGSNAETAGLKAGDVIVKAQNQPVHTLADLQSAYRAAANGSVAITVVRDKREQTLNLKLPERKAESGALFYKWPGDTLTELADATTLLRDSEELRQYSEQQKAWTKQFKDSQNPLQKPLQ